MDVIFPPPNEASAKKQYLPENLIEANRFELVFDETEGGAELKSTLKTRKEALSK